MWLTARQFGGASPSPPWSSDQGLLPSGHLKSRSDIQELMRWNWSFWLQRSANMLRSESKHKHSASGWMFLGQQPETIGDFRGACGAFSLPFTTSEDLSATVTIRLKKPDLCGACVKGWTKIPTYHIQKQREMGTTEAFEDVLTSIVQLLGDAEPFFKVLHDVAAPANRSSRLKKLLTNKSIAHLV